MKNRLLFLMLFFSICLTTNAQAADLQDGFMKYRWGEKIVEYDWLIKLYGNENATYYRSPGELYTLDDISINDVIFGAYQGKLFAVYIGIDTLELYDKINNYLRKKYGIPGTKVYTKRYLTTHKWKYQDVVIKLKKNEVEEKMKLGFYYTALSRDLNKLEAKNLVEPSYRFFPIDKNKKPERIPFLEF